MAAVAGKAIVKFEPDFSALTAGAAKVGAAIGVGLGLEAAAGFIKASITAAEGLQTAQRNVSQAFGASASVVEDFSKRSVTALGLSEGAALTAEGAMGRMLEGLGIPAQVAATDTIALQQRIADLASATGQSQDEITNAVEAGLRGRGMALKNYGIDISATTQLNEAHALGLVVVKNKLTDNQKAVVDLALIMKDSTNTVGDFGQTAADKMQIFHAAIGNAKEALGTALLPAVEQFSTWVSQHTGEIQHVATVIGQDLATGANDVGDAFKFISDHSAVFEGVVASLAGLYAVHKAGGIAGSVIGDLKGLFGAGGAVASGVGKLLGLGGSGGLGSVISNLKPQDVFVTNWAMMAGGKVLPGLGGGAAATGGVDAAIGSLTSEGALGALAGLGPAGALAAVAGGLLGLIEVLNLLPHTSARPPDSASLNPKGPGAGGPTSNTDMNVIMADLPAAGQNTFGQFTDKAMVNLSQIDQSLQNMGLTTDQASRASILIRNAYVKGGSVSVPQIDAIINGVKGISDNTELITGQFGLMKASLKAKAPMALVDIENFTHSLSLLPNHSGNLLNETANISNLMKAGKIKTAHDLGVYEDQWNYIQGHARNASQAQGILAQLISNGTITNAGQIKTFLSDWNTATDNMGGISPTLGQMETDLATSHDKTSTLPGIFSALMRDANGAAFSASVLAADLAAALARQGANASGYAGHTDTTAGPHAMGGTIRPGMWGTAGEGRAWELLHALPGGGVQVYPNRQSTQMARGGGVTIHQTINISGTTPESLLAQMDAKIGAHNAVLFNALQGAL